ncbi:Hexuronate transporter [compost metagenome]
MSVFFWSIAAIAHAFAKSTFGFGIARAGLGVAEAGNFPAAIKAVAEWFPKKQRALATGIFNSGANVGAIIAPIMVPAILGAYGWQEAFAITGAIGFIWLFFWWRYYETPMRHKKISKEEFDYIHSDNEVSIETGPSVKWFELFKIKETWAFIFGKFLTDPVWWFFLFWLPSYFAETFNLDLKKPSLPLVIIYTATTIGSIGGGFLSSYLIKKGWNVKKARKITMLVIAICVMPIMLAQFAQNIWVVVGLISLAAAAHQAWSANIFTTVSDYFPKKDVGSVVGIGGMAGSVGGILFPLATGMILDQYKALGNITVGYNIIFIMCGCAYLLAWLVMNFLTYKKG